MLMTGKVEAVSQKNNHQRTEQKSQFSVLVSLRVYFPVSMVQDSTREFEYSSRFIELLIAISFMIIYTT